LPPGSIVRSASSAWRRPSMVTSDIAGSERAKALRVAAKRFSLRFQYRAI
jgi:hypothetical protein